MSKEQASVIYNGKERRVAIGTRLADAFFVDAPCAGHGRCGKCRILASGALSEITDAERMHLTDAERAAGVRLACFTHILGDCLVQDLPQAGHASILTGGVRPALAPCPTFSHYGAAIDIGTTTVAAKAFDTSGACLADAACLNPQISLGADVISRIEAALDGKQQALADAVRGAVNSLLCTLTESLPQGGTIDRIVITGNTVMLHLLTLSSVEPLSHAPFRVGRAFNEVLPAASLGLMGLAADATVYLPPCISAFVGADTTCALLATGACKDTGTALLADIGTNGEMALFKDGRLTVCSTAAGPAFEGVGISMGMCATEGAISAVTIVNGQLHARTVGDLPPVGICGSGLVDAIACLLQLDELDENGHLESEKTVIAPNVHITREDIRALQPAKGAIAAGLLTMLDAEKCTVKDVDVFYVAGCFGSYLNFPNAARIGLFPKGLSQKATVIGNAAIEGAAMLLLDKGAADEAARIAREARVLELATDPIFADLFIKNMLF
ncbi:MAG: DUF4445 domain-containing protein [Ruminococcaceae bacterium]|nr:DUF4445 domain-containing protein [Oscillospiraceae bacterium]